MKNSPLRSAMATLISRKLIAFDKDDGPPAPKPDDKPEEKPEDKGETPEQKEAREKEEKAKNDMELKWKGLKLPDGATALDDKLIERTVAEARKRGLSPEHASGVLEFVNQEALSARDKAIKDHSIGGDEWKKSVEGWEADGLKDPELGNGNAELFQANITKARAVVDKYAPPAVKEFLHKSGFGSHPGVVKLFLNIAKAAGEGQFEMGKPDAKKDVATKFYGEAEDDKK